MNDRIQAINQAIDLVLEGRGGQKALARRRVGAEKAARRAAEAEKAAAGTKVGELTAGLQKATQAAEVAKGTRFASAATATVKGATEKLGAAKSELSAAEKAVTTAPKAVGAQFARRQEWRNPTIMGTVTSIVTGQGVLPARSSMDFVKSSQIGGVPLAIAQARKATGIEGKSIAAPAVAAPASAAVAAATPAKGEAKGGPKTGKGGRVAAGVATKLAALFGRGKKKEAAAEEPKRKGSGIAGAVAGALATAAASAAGEAAKTVAGAPAAGGGAAAPEGTPAPAAGGSALNVSTELPARAKARPKPKPPETA